MTKKTSMKAAFCKHALEAISGLYFKSKLELNLTKVELAYCSTIFVCFYFSICT